MSDERLEISEKNALVKISFVLISAGSFFFFVPSGFSPTFVPYFYVFSLILGVAILALFNHFKRWGLISIIFICGMLGTLVLHALFYKLIQCLFPGLDYNSDDHALLVANDDFMLSGYFVFLISAIVVSFRSIFHQTSRTDTLLGRFGLILSVVMYLGTLFLKGLSKVFN